MPVRHFLLYTLFLLLPALAATRARAQALPPLIPSSVWWYPLGDMEGTRRNITPNLNPQSDSSLVVKWRSSAIRNAPVVLVGGIRTVPGDSSQQVVGISNGTAVVIVSSLGLTQVNYSYTPSFQNAFTLSLTGLFNSNARSPLPTGLPNRIGIGVEREQPAALNALYGVLADASGKSVTNLEIDPLPAGTPGNRTSAVYPVAMYSRSVTSSVVLVAVSQNAHNGAAATPPANSLRSYTVSTTNNTATLKWSYPVAPRSHAQAPALTVDDRGVPDSTYIALSTSAYNFIPPITVQPTQDPPVSGVATRSDSMYSVEIATRVDTPFHLSTIGLPLPVSGGSTSLGEAHSYFVALAPGRDTSARYYRLISENHSPSAPGTGRLLLGSALKRSDSLFGMYTESDPAMTSFGWTIVAADIDKENDVLAQKINPGDEIIAAWSDPNGKDLEHNWLYAFARTWVENVDLNQRPFGYFARQFFSGRLLCAGDLVSRSSVSGQFEILIANRDTLHVLELIKYSDPSYGGIGDPVTRKYFRTLRSFVLDSPIRYAAIADVENDGLNDIVVATEQATYAIGIKVADPFGTVASSDDVYCHGRDVVVTWNRRVGGGESGVDVFLEKEGSASVKVRPRFLDPATVTGLNPGTGASTLSFADTMLAPGRYRVILADPFVPSLADTSNWFTVDAPAFNPVTLDTGGVSPDFGGAVTLGTRVRCSDGLVALRSYDNGATWDTVDVVMAGDSATAVVGLPCLTGQCGLVDDLTIRLRFGDVNGFGESETKEVVIPVAPRPLALDAVTDDGRTGRITWSPSDYSCGAPHVVLVDTVGAVVYEFPRTVQPGDTAFSFSIPADTLSGRRVAVRICCEEGDCHYGKTTAFEIPPATPDTFYVAPNPFNPDIISPERPGAHIVYRLAKPGTVALTIYDAGRAVVRRLADAESHAGMHRNMWWDGTNSRGDKVASGTYICTVISSSGEHYVLPIIVIRH